MQSITVRAVTDDYVRLTKKLAVAGISFNGVEHQGQGTYTLRRIPDVQVPRAKAIIGRTIGVTIVNF